MKVAEALYKAAFLTPAGQMPADKQVPVTKEMSGIRRAAGTFHNFTQQHMDYMTGGPVKRMMRPGKPVEKLAFEKYALSYNRIMAAIAGRSNSIENALSTANTSKAGYIINKTRNQAQRMSDTLKGRLGEFGHYDAMSSMTKDTNKLWNDAKWLYLTNTYKAMGKALKAGKPKSAEKLLARTADGLHLPVTMGPDGGKSVMAGGRARLSGRFTNIAPNKMGDAINRTEEARHSAWMKRPVTDSMFHIN